MTLQGSTFFSIGTFQSNWAFKIGHSSSIARGEFVSVNARKWFFSPWLARGGSCIQQPKQNVASGKKFRSSAIWRADVYLLNVSSWNVPLRRNFFLNISKEKERVRVDNLWRNREEWRWRCKWKRILWRCERLESIKLRKFKQNLPKINWK